MIAGIGTDIVEIPRLEAALKRNGESFLNRVLAPEEREQYEQRGRSSLSYLAGRWAAKEALAKALGTGIGADCALTDIIVLDDPSGKPDLSLSGDAKRTASAKGMARFHLSIAHDGGFAVAFVTAETENP